MHHYQHNIGDYAKKTGRLSMLEHGAYRTLMDCIYDRERFPTRDEAIDWVWASTTEEVEAVEFVLRRFFELQEDGTYVQKRIAEELETYLEKCLKQAERGRKGGRPKKSQEVLKETQKNPAGLSENPAASHRVSEKSLTSNQEPVTSNQGELPDGNSCSEPSRAADPAHPPDNPHVATLPTNRHGSVGEVYSVTKSDFEEFRGLYPAVDVRQQLNAMRGWLVANPEKRKTKRGMPRFINAWLAREQDRGRQAETQQPKVLAL